MKQLRENYEHLYKNLVLRKIEKNNEKKKKKSEKREKQTKHDLIK